MTFAEHYCRMLAPSCNIFSNYITLHYITLSNVDVMGQLGLLIFRTRFCSSCVGTGSQQSSGVSRSRSLSDGRCGVWLGMLPGGAVSSRTCVQCRADEQSYKSAHSSAVCARAATEHIDFGRRTQHALMSGDMLQWTLTGRYSRSCCLARCSRPSRPADRMPLKLVEPDI